MNVKLTIELTYVDDCKDSLIVKNSLLEIYNPLKHVRYNLKLDNQCLLTRLLRILCLESKTLQRLALEAFINCDTFGKFLPNQLCDSLHKSYMQSSSDKNIGEFCNIFVSNKNVGSDDSENSETCCDEVERKLKVQTIRAKIVQNNHKLMQKLQGFLNDKKDELSMTPSERDIYFNN